MTLERAAWVHQTDQLGEQTPADYAATLLPRGIKSVYLKALDGVYWMADVYSHPLAPSAANWLNLVQQFRAVGLTLLPWVVPRDGTPAEVTRHVTAGQAAGGLIVDFEYHYDGFYRGSAAQAVAYFDQLRRAGLPWLAVAPDPRQVGRDYSASILHDMVIQPQTYWTDFQRPALEVLEQGVGLGIPGARGYEPILPYNATPQDMAAALDWCRQRSIQAVSLWRMGTADAAQLDAFATEPAPPVPVTPVHAGAGVNVDPLNPAGRPSPADLKALGVAWVRLVSRHGVESYVQDCQAAGLKVLAVVAKESGGYVFGGPEIWQIGNEPDATGPASWTMTPDEYVQQWALYRGTYPDLVMVGAGLASGDPGWWRQVAGHLQGCSAVAVHPYGKTADQAAALLDQYRQITPTVLVTEWNRHADEISGYAAMLDQSSAGSWWFCHSDGMVNGFGLVDANGQPKPEYHALRAALTGAPVPQPTPTPPQPAPSPPTPTPTPDLKALADALEQAAAYLRQQAA